MLTVDPGFRVLTGLPVATPESG
ncbi:hypothetical protein GPN2_20660 [Streptomyces murinus]